MRSKKTLLNGAKLYLILDRDVRPYHRLIEIAREAVQAGVDLIQLRDKDGSAKDVLDFSKRLLSMTRGKVPLIINDRVDLAVAAKAAGVHLGQEDLPLKQARRIIGNKAIIGLSCQTLGQALQAEREGADYVGFGSVFKTLTKPGRTPQDLHGIRRVFKRMRIPVFAIGGIDLTKASQLKMMGVGRIAVCRSICLAKNIDHQVHAFKRLVG